MIAKPRLVVAGHTHGDEGTITVDAVQWTTTLSALARSERVIRDLEREIKTLTTGEGAA